MHIMSLSIHISYKTSSLALAWHIHILQTLLSTNRQKVFTNFFHCFLILVQVNAQWFGIDNNNLESNEIYKILQQVFFTVTYISYWNPTNEK